MQIVSPSYASVGLIQRYQTQIKTGLKDGQGDGVVKNQAVKTLDAEQQRAIQGLKDRDREVRTHEQAHLSAAGGIAARGASFQFVTGPDGQRYAVGGEVGIDTSKVEGDPTATLRKADAIRRAAMAPAQPSAQDFNVASMAAAMARQASVELIRLQKDTKPSGSMLDVNV